MAAGLTEAILRRPPRANGTNVPGQGYVLTLVAATASAETVVLAGLGMAPTMGGTWVTFVATADTTIRFGLTGQVGNASATASDFLLPASHEAEFWVTYPDDASFSARSTAGGTLYWYRSSR